MEAARGSGSPHEPEDICFKVPHTPTRAQRKQEWNDFLPLTPAEAFLSEAGLLHLHVIKTLRQFEVSDRSDLAFLFLTVAEAADVGLREQWQAARREARPDATQRATPCVKVPPAVPLPRPASAQFKLKRARPPTKTAARTALQDEAARRHAATKAVSLSMQWAPAAGLAAKWPDLEQDQAMHFRAACVRRVTKFEAKAIYGHMRVWHHWCAWARQRRIPELSAALPIVEEFIETFTVAPTAARSRWDSFAWLRKHLAAPYAVDSTTRPPRKTKGGEVEPEAQAPVCEPELLLHLETVAASMRRSAD